MRILVATALGLACFTAVAADDYQEVRELGVSADGARQFIIDVGAGSLDVRGVAGQETIKVRARIVIDDGDEDEARAFISEQVKISLEREGETVRLVTDVEQSMWSRGSGGRVDVEVTAPAGLATRIDDGSGSIDVEDLDADIVIDDGSGSIELRNVGAVQIDDGSGSIDVSNATGDVYVNDGSGSITIEDVGGTVTIDDGSGSIRVRKVGQDLVIIDAGSGSISFSDVKGTVEQDG
ncbi:MAG: hypothetical protein P8X98_00030 [Woeseiaceae bacterium]